MTLHFVLKSTFKWTKLTFIGLHIIIFSANLYVLTQLRFWNVLETIFRRAGVAWPHPPQGRSSLPGSASGFLLQAEGRATCLFFLGWSGLPIIEVGASVLAPFLPLFFLQAPSQHQLSQQAALGLPCLWPVLVAHTVPGKLGSPQLDFFEMTWVKNYCHFV